MNFRTSATVQVPLVPAPAGESDHAEAEGGGGAPDGSAVPGCLTRTAELVTPALSEVVARLPKTLRVPVEHHLAGGGKHLRSALVLLSAEACGGEGQAALPGAVAIELVHNFSLLHDDIIDGDRERRHRPTVWAEFGLGPAVVSGDALLVLAVQHLLEVSTPARVHAATVLTHLTQAMIAGQAKDMAFETARSVSFEECLEMEWQKTGALLSCAASLGAILSGANGETVFALAEYGGHVGIAFQAVDDVLGIWGDPSITGKPVGSDLLGHKMTLPVVAAIAASNGSGSGLEALLDEIAGRTPPDESLLDEARRMLEAAGALEAAKDVADAHLEAALGALGDVKLEKGPLEELVELAQFVVRRNW